MSYWPPPSFISATIWSEVEARVGVLDDKVAVIAGGTSGIGAFG